MSSKKATTYGTSQIETGSLFKIVNNMQLFKCKLLNKKGDVIEEYLVAKSVNDLKKSFDRNNFVFISAKKQKSFIKSPYNDFTIPFLRNLVQLVKNKFDLIVSLEVTSKIFSNIESILIINHIINDIKHGMSFSAAFSKFDRFFNDFVIKTIEISEKTAKLPEALMNIIGYLETDLKLRQKIRKAVRYPIILLICVSFVFFFWMFVIVPKFSDLFSEMGVSLPFYTKIIIKFSEFLINNSLYIFLCILIFIIIIARYFKLSDISLKIPVIFNIKQRLLILNFFNAMSIMTKEKINLIDCLSSLENQYPEVKKIKKFIEGGNTFATSLMKSKMFPDFDISIIETAEKSGNLNSAFQTIVVLTESYIENKLDELIKLIPTLAICFIGILLTVIVCSMVIPIYSGINLGF